MPKEALVRFPCGTAALEGALTRAAEGKSAPGAVVCHPHPLYGGTMDNCVVLAVVRALAERGFAVLRFNFRGVGGSGGTHGGGDAEAEDVVAALDLLTRQGGVDPARLAVAGYSFGAAVGLKAACSDPRVRALALVAPPLVAFPMAEVGECRLPKLAVTGTRDAYCPEVLLESWLAVAAEPKSRVVVAGADHFFAGREDEVGTAVAGFLTGSLGSARGSA